MATRAQNLDTAIDAVVALINSVTTSPKPSYSIDGESYSWGEYLQTLTGQLIELEKARQRADGPFEEISYGA